MSTKYSQRRRTLIAVSGILPVLLVIAWLALAALTKTSIWAAVPAVAAYLDPDKDGPTTAWMLLAGMLAVMMILYLVANRFWRKGSRDRVDDSLSAPQSAVSDPALPIFPNYLQLPIESASYAALLVMDALGYGAGHVDHRRYAVHR